MATYDDVRAAVERNEVDTALAALETLAAERNHRTHEVSLHRAHPRCVARQLRERDRPRRAGRDVSDTVTTLAADALAAWLRPT